MPELPGPLYLDASAVVKLYFPETESVELNRRLHGRRDALISDLAVTEIVSSLSRRRRQGSVGRDDIMRLHSKLLEDVESGLYRRIELVSPVHREAERLLMASESVPLRAADALHLALALTGKARCVVTYDQRLAEATKSAGLRAFP